MLKMTCRLLVALLLAMPVLAVAGCGGGESVEIPTNPDKKSPGRPAVAGMGEGEGSGPNTPDAPPPALPPE